MVEGEDAMDVLEGARGDWPCVEDRFDVDAVYLELSPLSVLSLSPCRSVLLLSMFCAVGACLGSAKVVPGGRRVWPPTSEDGGKRVLPGIPSQRLLAVAVSLGGANPVLLDTLLYADMML